MAWKWIPCWYASSLWSGTLESATSSTRLYLFLAGITEGKPADDADHSGLHGSAVPIPNAPVPCVIPERLQQRVGGGDAVHCCCLELGKVRSSRGARLGASLLNPDFQSRLYFLIGAWKRCAALRSRFQSRWREISRRCCCTFLSSVLLGLVVVEALQPPPAPQSRKQSPYWSKVTMHDATRSRERDAHPRHPSCSCDITLISCIGIYC